MPLLPVQIVPMRDEDLEECASFIDRRVLFYPHRLHDPSVSAEQRLARRMLNLRANLENPKMRLFVARAKADGNIAGWTSWSEPRTDSQDPVGREIPANAAGDDPERDSEIVARVKADKAKNAEAVFGSRPFWVLEELYINPKLRRSGVGTTLVKHGLDKVAQETPSVTLVAFSASPAARPMYERFRFRVVNYLDYTVQDLDDQGKMVAYRYRWPYMANAWDHLSEEELERLASIKACGGSVEEV